MTQPLYTFIQKSIHFIVQKTTLWLVLFLLGSALTAWLLAFTLQKENNRDKEARLARNTAFAYLTLTMVLSVLRFLFQ